jgi:hypothetical protein
MTSPMATAVAPARGERKGTTMHTDEALASLARALTREAEAVQELRAALVRQREGVAADATDAVNGSCDDIARLLVTLDSAKRVRVELLSRLLPDGPGTMEALAAACGGSLPPALAVASQALRREAATAANEAAVNRVVLQRTVEAGEAFLQALFAGAGDRDSVYRSGERRDDDGAGFLLDRTA